MSRDHYARKREAGSVEMSGKSDQRLPDKAADEGATWNDTAHWSSAKRRWRAIFATVVFLAVFSPFYFLFSAHWLGLLLGWMPASGLAGLGYYSPRQLAFFLLIIAASFLRFMPIFH